MYCYHCGGRHDSDYCPGYGVQSLNHTANEIQSGIDGLSRHNEQALAIIAERAQAISEGQGDVAGTLEEFSTSLEGQLDDLGYQLGDAIDRGAERVAGAVHLSSVVNAVGFTAVAALTKGVRDELASTHETIELGFAALQEGLVGVGAAIAYREEMDALRHGETIELHEEASVAGRARRELAAAAVAITEDSDTARSHVQRSIEFFPTAAEAYRMRGMLESMADDHKRAGSSFRLALKYTEKGALVPTLRPGYKPNCKAIDNTMIGCTVQLAYELAAQGDVKQALAEVGEAVKRFPDSADLRLARVRLLSKCNSIMWRGLRDKFISALVRSSPLHFNVLYCDTQLGGRLVSARNSLLQLKAKSSELLLDKAQALDMLTHGASDLATSCLASLSNTDLSYVEVVRLNQAAIENIRKLTHSL